MNKFKLLIIAFVLLLLMASLFFYVQFVNFLFQIQKDYDSAPSWLIAVYIVGVILIALAGLWLLLRIRRFTNASSKKSPKTKPIINDDESFHNKLQHLKQSGVQTDSLMSQWEKLVKLRESETITLALFGKVNVGKSSLIEALTNSNTEISAKAGQTQQIKSYNFSRDNRNYELFDMPGLNEVDSVVDVGVYDKAIKSHLVIFVTDEDFNASTFETYQTLLQYDKPIIIVLNKKDYYTNEERELISAQIHSQINKTNKNNKSIKNNILKPDFTPIIWVSSRITKFVEVTNNDGENTLIEKTSIGDVSELIENIEIMTFDRLGLDKKLSTSFYQVLDSEMSNELIKTRHQKSEIIIKSYTQKAMFGGMASVGPGTDVLLQGYLGLNMAKALCEIYQVNTDELDLQNMLMQTSTKIKKESAMILSLAGNALKAFPGIGTIAGGALHAIAYGLIFEAVGKAIVHCLENNEKLDNKTILQQIEVQMHGNLEQSAKRLAKLALSKKINE